MHRAGLLKHHLAFLAMDSTPNDSIALLMILNKISENESEIFSLEVYCQGQFRAYVNLFKFLSDLNQGRKSDLKSLGNFQEDGDSKLEIDVHPFNHAMGHPNLMYGSARISLMMQRMALHIKRQIVGFHANYVRAFCGHFVSNMTKASYALDLSNDELLLMTWLLVSFLAIKEEGISLIIIKSLHALANVFKSSKDLLAISSILELKRKLNKMDTKVLTLEDSSLLKGLLEFVLTASGSPITKSIATRTLDLMLSYDSHLTYSTALDCIVHKVHTSDASSQDFINILFSEYLKAKGNPFKMRGLASCMYNLMKDNRKLAIQCIDILDSMLHNQDYIIKCIGIQTIYLLTSEGVFEADTSWKVILRGMPTLPQNRSCAKAWIQFHSLLNIEDMEEEALESLFLEMYKACSIDAHQLQIQAYDILSKFPKDFLDKKKEVLLTLLSRNPHNTHLAKDFLSKMINLESGEMRHLRLVKGVRNDSSGDSLKSKLNALGKYISMNAFRSSNTVGEVFGAAMLWCASDMRPSQAGSRHPPEDFMRVCESLMPRFESRNLLSFQIQRSTYNIYINGWWNSLESSDLSGDKLKCLYQQICSVATNSNENNQTLRASLVGFTKNADEIAHDISVQIIDDLLKSTSSHDLRTSIFSSMMLFPGLALSGMELLYKVTEGIYSFIDKVRDQESLSTCFKALGYLAYYMADHEAIQKDNSGRSSRLMTCIITTTINLLSSCVKIPQEIQICIPAKWKASNAVVKNVANNLMDDEVVHGAFVTLGWIAEAALKGGEDALHVSIYTFVASEIFDFLNLDKPFNAQVKDGCATGCILIYPALVKRILSSKHRTSEIEKQIMDIISFMHYRLSADSNNFERSMQQSLSACLGALVDTCLAQSIPIDIVQTESILDAFHMLAVEKRADINTRIGSLIGLFNALGCSKYIMPCHHEEHSTVVREEFVWKYFDTINQWTRDESEPQVQSALAWLSQLLYYILCSNECNVTYSETKKVASTVPSKSYIKFCLQQIQTYRNCVSTTKMGTLPLYHPRAAVNCMKCIQDDEVVNTLHLAFDLIQHEISNSMEPSIEFLRECFDLISNHKSIHNCTASDSIGYVIDCLQMNAHGNQGIVEVACEKLSLILVLCSELNAKRMIDKLPFKVSHKLGLSIWEGFDTYFSKISNQKPRLYRKVYEHTIQYAIEFISVLPLPSYEEAVEFLFDADSKNVVSVWSALSMCALISKGEGKACHTMIQEVVSKEKACLMQLLICKKGRLALPDLICCQKLFVRCDNNMMWALPLLCHNIENALRNRQIELTQWLLDLFHVLKDEHSLNGLSLFSNVVMRSARIHPLLSEMCTWISPAFSIEMLPLSLQKLMECLPSSFATLLSHKLLYYIIDLPKDDPKVERIVPALLPLRSYFSNNDIEGLIEIMKYII